MCWKDISEAPKEFVNNKPVIIVGSDKLGNISKTLWHHIEEEWMMLTGEGFMVWHPDKWVELP